MSDRPARIGIVVAAYNAAPYLADTLESIQRQTFGAWECVVVDDGSHDDTVLVARRFAQADTRIKLLRQENTGYCRARNRGLAVLGDVDAVTVMDSDDIWFPATLDILADRMAERPDCIGAHGLGQLIDSTGAPIDAGAFEAFGRARISGATGRLRPWPADGDTMFETIISSSSVFPPGLLLMRRSIYDMLGGYDEQSVEGDWDLLIRAMRLGSLAFVDKVVIQYRRHGSNFGASTEIPILTRMTLVRAHRSSNNTPAQRTVLRRCWRAQQREALIRHMATLRNGGDRREQTLAPLRLLVAAARCVRGRPGIPVVMHTPRARRIARRWWGGSPR
jgi:glycosyltransferase involved in cell wall biosynthesis